MRWVFWIFIALVAIVAANFAVWNSHGVSLDLWPLPLAFDLPVFLAVLAPFGIGLLMGWLGSWFAHLPDRRARRRLQRHAETLAAELDRTKTAPPAAPPSRSLVA